MHLMSAIIFQERTQMVHIPRRMPINYLISRTRAMARTLQRLEDLSGGGRSTPFFPEAI
jgi:hypothetical protein